MLNLAHIMFSDSLPLFLGTKKSAKSTKVPSTKVPFNHIQGLRCKGTCSVKPPLLLNKQTFWVFFIENRLFFGLFFVPLQLHIDIITKD